MSHCLLQGSPGHVTEVTPAALQVLDDFQNDPAAAQRHLQRPEIMANIQKLVKAGIVKLG